MEYKLEVTLHMTIVANNIDDANDEADWHVSRLTDQGMLGDYGYTVATYEIAPLPEKE